MHEWSLLGSLCWRQGWGVVLLPIPFCFHHPRMIPCYPNTDSNMTCHSEREQRHWGLLQACPLCNFGREHYSTMAALRLRALGSMHPGCKPSAPTPSPPTEPLLYQEAPTVTALPYLYCCTYWLLILIVVIVTVFFFFSSISLCTYDICLSLYHSTNSSNKTGPDKKKKIKKREQKILKNKIKTYLC